MTATLMTENANPGITDSAAIISQHDSEREQGTLAPVAFFQALIRRFAASPDF